MTYQARVSTSEKTGTGPGATNAPTAVCRLTTSASNGARTWQKSRSSSALPRAASAASRLARSASRVPTSFSAWSIFPRASSSPAAAESFAVRAWSILSGVTNSRESSGSRRWRLSVAFLSCASIRCTLALAAATAKRWPSMRRSVTAISPSSAATSTRALERELVRARVDDEEQVALLHALVVLDVQLGDRAAHLRHDADDVRRDDRVVGLRVAHHPLDDDDRQDHEPGHDAEGDQPADRTPPTRHPSSRTPSARWRGSGDRRGRDRPRLRVGDPPRRRSRPAPAGQRPSERRRRRSRSATPGRTSRGRLPTGTPHNRRRRSRSLGRRKSG